MNSINNGYDTITWERMVELKQKILKIWDTATPTVKICCIKFAQRVVLAQTSTAGIEHRVCRPLCKYMIKMKQLII